MPALPIIRNALIAAVLALAVGSGFAWAIDTSGAPPPPEPGTFAFSYQSSLGGTFHPSGDFGTPSLADLARIDGQPSGEMFTLDTASSGTLFEAIPEPAAVLPLLVGLLGLGFALKRRRRR